MDATVPGVWGTLAAGAGADAGCRDTRSGRIARLTASPSTVSLVVHLPLRALPSGG